MSLYVQMCSCMMIYANLDFSDRPTQPVTRLENLTVYDIFGFKMSDVWVCMG